LSKKDYNEIRAMNSDARKRGAMDVVTISNGDSVVLQGMQYITSSDPNLLIAALFPLSGMRPIEVVKMAQFKTNLNNKQEHQSFWACQTRFAKRGTMKSSYNPAGIDRSFVRTG
jgi:predicted nucleotide-binding protein (sugar kinase/HSP70/actin superfamily)